ncbi:MAG TPA: hypothetical protein VGR29_09775 [Thermomicrobiales bacterium]|nr:hypothetical protein [Thermomicrobiales bacterium]
MGPVEPAPIRRDIAETNLGTTVNPYVLTGLVMCIVIIIALIGTSYLAVYFTRRAKVDLEQLLTPLAELLDGEVEIEEAEVKGRWRGYLVMARMANAAAGTVRIFQIDMIDPAGGDGWNFVYSRPRKGHPEPEIDFQSTNQSIRAALAGLEAFRLAPLEPGKRDWLQLEYSPDAGYVRLARPMHGRNEIPAPLDFQVDLDYLVQLCDENRALQELNRGGGEEGVKS